jgi:hypothetical protein
VEAPKATPVTVPKAAVTVPKAAVEVSEAAFVVPKTALYVPEAAGAVSKMSVKHRRLDMAGGDWIPTREQDLVDLCEKWKAALADPAKVTAFGWVQAEVTAVLGRINAFLSARTAYGADNSTAKRIAKDDAKKETVDAMRDFANSSIRFNKSMDDEAKEQMGIHPADRTPTSHGTPTSQPDTVVENSANHFEHKVRALNHATGSTSKPADAYGVRYAWQVGGEKPASGEDLPNSKFSRKTTFTVTHTEADKAKTAYYAACYENGKGDTGPWSPVEEAVIG